MADLTTYDDVVTEFYSLIGDDATNQRLATTSQIDVWANSVMYDLAEHCEYLDEYSAATTAPSTTVSYTDPNAMLLSVWRVEIGDEVIFPITTKQLYKSSRSWRQDTGEPRFYYLDSLRTFDDDNYRVGFYPYSTSNFKIGTYFCKSGDALSYANKANNVMLPQWAVPALLWGIMAHYYEHSGRKQNRQTAALFRAMYTDVRSRLRQRASAKGDECRVWGERQAYVAGDDWMQLIPSDGVTGY